MEKRQNQRQSRGLKQQEGGKGLSRILIMHTTHTYTHRHPYQQTPVISPEIQLCRQSELSPWWSGRCEVNSKALRGDLDFTQTHTEICAVTLSVSFTELHHNHSTLTQRTNSHADRSHRDNTVLLPMPHSNAHFHMRAYIQWEFTHTCHMEPPMHSPWQKYLPVSPQSICTRTDWVTHMHTHTHTGAHKHAQLDNWWRAVYCSRWTLSKLTSGSWRINYSIKSHQDHTTWWMLNRSGGSQLSALQFTQTRVNFFSKRNHLVVFIF